MPASTQEGSSCRGGVLGASGKALAVRQTCERWESYSTRDFLNTQAHRLPQAKYLNKFPRFPRLQRQGLQSRLTKPPTFSMVTATASNVIAGKNIF